MSVSKTILISGVTGFLGSNLAAALIEEGHLVIALKRKSSSLARISGIISRMRLYDIEDIDYAHLFKTHGKIDAVIHTATCYGRNNESAWEIYDANTRFPLQLLDAASHAKVILFINTDTILDKFLNLYSLSKNHLLDWGKFYSLQKKIKFINMKLEHFYGPGDDDSKFTSYVINNCLLNTKILKLTLGEQRRDFIYIADVVSAYLAMLTQQKKQREWFTEYEIGSGISITVREFVTRVHELTSSKTHLAFGSVPYRVGEVMDSRANTSALRALGWRCKTNLEQGLKLTIQERRI